MQGELVVAAGRPRRRRLVQPAQDVDLLVDLALAQQLRSSGSAARVSTEAKPCSSKVVRSAVEHAAARRCVGRAAARGSPTAASAGGGRAARTVAAVGASGGPGQSASQVRVGGALARHGGGRSVARVHHRLVGAAAGRRSSATPACRPSSRRAGRCARSSPRTARHRTSTTGSAPVTRGVEREQHAALRVPRRVADGEAQAGEVEQLGRRASSRTSSGSANVSPSTPSSGVPGGMPSPDHGSASIARSAGWTYAATPVAWQTGSTEKVWSRWPWVSSTATGCSRCRSSTSDELGADAHAGVDDHALLARSGGHDVAVGARVLGGESLDEHPPTLPTGFAPGSPTRG